MTLFQPFARPVASAVHHRGVLCLTLLFLLSACGTAVRTGSERPPAPGSAGWSQISGSCGMTPAGALCWAWDAAGQNLPPAPVSQSVELAYIAGSLWQGCGLSREGGAWCWGTPFAASSPGPPSESCGAPGIRPCEVTPKAILPGESFARLSVGYGYACGVLRSAAVACWGSGVDRRVPGDLGQAGRCPPGGPCPGMTSFSDRRYASVAAGEAHACALDESGAAYCWGLGPFGELGTRTTEQCAIEATTMGCATRPAAVQAGLRFATLTAGRTHTCGLTTDGAAFCWGSNSLGQLGTEAELENCLYGHIGTPCAFQPVPVAGDLRFRAISAAADHTCAIAVEGSTWCWGDGAGGQLGQGIIERSYPHGMRRTPVKVLGDQRFVEISAAGTCGRTAAGELYCWGIHSPDRDIAAPLRMPPPPSAAERLISFGSRPLPERPGIQATLRFVGDTLHVEGVAPLQCTTNSFYPAFTREGTRLQFWMIARRWLGGGCEETDQLVAFDARIGPITPGSYQLDIIHHYAEDADRMRPGGLSSIELIYPPPTRQESERGRAAPPDAGPPR